MQEHLVRHGAAVQADVDLVGAGVVRGAYDALDDLVRRAPRHVFGLLADALQRQTSVALAVARDEWHVLGLEIVVR